MRALGIEVAADLYACDPAALDDPALVREGMLEAARRCGATIVTDCFHRFEPHGVSGAVLIAESHLAIHTWPEHRYAAVNLFTCGADLRPEVGLAHLAQVLGSQRCHERKLLRGHAPTLPGVPRHRLASRPVTLLDGGPRGAEGHTLAVLAPLVTRLRAAAELRVVHLASADLRDEALERVLRESAAFVVATGTEGDTWAGPLQRFLERAAHVEAEWGLAWLGKPAAVVVTRPAAGDRVALARLQGVLSALGCQIPPMSGMVCAPAPGSELGDFDTLCHNLLEAASGGADYRPWSAVPPAEKAPR